MRHFSTRDPPAGGRSVDSDLQRMTDGGGAPAPARWDDPCWLDNLGVWDTFDDEPPAADDPDTRGGACPRVRPSGLARPGPPLGLEADRDLFLRAGVEWSGVAAALRDRYPAGDDPLLAASLGLWREAGWCHLLYAAGEYPALVGRLRAVLRGALGAPPAPPGRAEALAVAAEVFGRLRLAASARYPAAFGPPAAA